jgi:hypothetical protein
MTTPAKIKHTIHSFPQDTTLEELERVTTLLHPQRSAFTYSADAAHAIVHAGTPESVVVVWDGERWGADDIIFTWLHQRGLRTEARRFDGTPVPDHDGDPTAPPQTPARINHTIHLLPQDTTLPELRQVTTHLHPTRSAFTYSADAAHALMFAGTPQSTVVVWSGERWAPGDIFAWLKERDIKFTVERFENLAGSQFIFTHWPTEHREITQAYNVPNPVFYPPPLTGHEGVDLEAPLNSKIFAGAPGTVYLTRDADENHPYGNAVYIRHKDGYRSAYAHLQERLVDIGDEVQGGQLIGIANSTGNVFPGDDPVQASHLHLTLYHDGATARGETEQPFDIIDPTPYLQHLLDGWESPQEPLAHGWANARSLELRGHLARVLTSFIILRSSPGPNQPRLGRIPGGTILLVTGPKNAGTFPVAVSEKNLNRAAVQLLVGIHNQDGAQWMLDNGVSGCALFTVALGGNGTKIDATRFEAAGIKVLVRLNYGYHPQGTIPSDDDPQYEPFISACVYTMLNSSGVWGFILGNETNNPAEYPQGEAITPERYATLYNRIWDQVPTHIPMGVQAVDPYFGPGSDNRDYWLRILNNIYGADFLTVHPKTQDSNPENVDSPVKFSDHPLLWQFLHLRAYQPLLDVVPDRFKHLPVFATEVNPQRHNDNRTLGWQEDQGPEWVRRAVSHFNTYNDTAVMPIQGVIFYRYSQDDWRLHNKAAILEAIKQAA